MTHVSAVRSNSDERGHGSTTRYVYRYHFTLNIERLALQTEFSVQNLFYVVQPQVLGTAVFARLPGFQRVALESPSPHSPALLARAAVRGVHLPVSSPGRSCIPAHTTVTEFNLVTAAARAVTAFRTSA